LADMGERVVSEYYDFQKCLDMSHDAEDYPFWEQVYREAFPGVVAIVSHRADSLWQRSGVDRSITLGTSKQILVDEKIRGRNKITGKVYNDIALEYISNDRQGSPGWVCKPLLCDYIAYAIAPIGKCYLLPVIQLQSAWVRNKDEWLSRHGQRAAQNKSYKTFFCPVPVNVLFPAIGCELRISFEAFEYSE